MHIVLVVPDLATKSGWSRYAVDLGRALVEQGHRVSCLVRRKEDVDWAEEYPVFSKDAHNTLRVLTSSLRARRTLRRLRPDVIHFVAEPYALILPILGSGPWKTCITLHGTYAAQLARAGGMLGWLVRRTFRQLDIMLSVSRFTKAHMERCNPSLFRALRLDQKIAVLPNAVDLTGTHSADRQNAVKQILSVGALKARKGQHLVLEACGLLRRQSDVPFRYRIIGSMEQNPGYVEELRAKIQELDLQDCVELAGTVTEEELREAYRTADLFMMLSQQEGDWFEGFGLVFLEANVWGVPVIGPDTGGCPEAIREGKSGYICDPRNAEQVAGRMADILRKNAIRHEDCRAWAEAHDIRQAAQELLRAYRSAPAHRA